LSNDEHTAEKDIQQAEVFDALGHPTRIVILKALNDGPSGFAELKKKTGIESSRHLLHHLNKLNGLVKTDEYGKYCLSDQGKDALLSVQTVEKVAELKANRKAADYIEHVETILKGIAVLFAVLLVISSSAAFYQLKETGLFEQTIFLGVGFFVCLGGYLRIQAEYVSKVRASNKD
jgi:DNA-binding HxlR family transcriptional regulator